VASQVRNKEGDVVLPLSVNTKVNPQDGCNRWPIRLLYPRIEIGLGSSLKGTFRNLASFMAH